MATGAHITVLLDEAVQALLTEPDGSYVDCTYGRGGHAGRIAEGLGPNGRLLVMDRDAAAIQHATQTFADDARVTVQHGDFSDIGTHAKRHGFELLDGVLMDLGVSSPQLDDAERGFSFSRPGPLDMRMDQTSGGTAAEWLATATEKEIANVLWRYGEERFARRIARAIVQARGTAPIETTARLVAIIEAAVPTREQRKHPATRSFQAIRIKINRELEELERGLVEVMELLRAGGRIVVISFHSLEDRIVKRYFRRMATADHLPPDLPIRDSEVPRKLKIVGKPVRVSAAEVSANPRARSAIMRVAEKLP